MRKKSETLCISGSKEGETIVFFPDPLLTGLKMGGKGRGTRLSFLTERWRESCLNRSEREKRKKLFYTLMGVLNRTSRGRGKGMGKYQETWKREVLRIIGGILTT